MSLGDFFRTGLDLAVSEPLIFTDAITFVSLILSGLSLVTCHGVPSSGLFPGWGRSGKGASDSFPSFGLSLLNSLTVATSKLQAAASPPVLACSDAVDRSRRGQYLGHGVVNETVTIIP